MTDAAAAQRGREGLDDDEGDDDDDDDDEEEEEDGGGVDASTAVGDVLHSLLQLCTSKNTQVQLHAAAALSYPCRHEPNRERISALGGVPILLELATPLPWRPTGLLRSAASVLGNLSLSPAVREQAHAVGGWKSLLLLGKSDARARFDAIRTLGNLAEHPGLRKAMLAEGSLSLALSLLKGSDLDLAAQAARLLGALSLEEGEKGRPASSASAAFGNRKVLAAMGASCRAAHKATATKDAESNGSVLPEFCSAYAQLALLEEYQGWLFGLDGVEVMQRFEAYVGPGRANVRVNLAHIIARCLRLPLNRRIILERLTRLDDRTDAFRRKSTEEQRALIQKEKDALVTGREVRVLMDSLLHGTPRKPGTLVHYAEALERLAEERANHGLLLQRPSPEHSYIRQLIVLAGGRGPKIKAAAPVDAKGGNGAAAGGGGGGGAAAAGGDASRDPPIGEVRQAAIRGLRLVADTGDSDSDGMCESLLRMGAVEALLEGCLCAHEPTQLEVTRVVRAMAAQSYVADMLVRHDLTFAHMKLIWQTADASQRKELARVQPKLTATDAWATSGADGGGGGDAAAAAEPPPMPFLAVLGSMLGSPSLELQRETCVALKAFAEVHKVPICRAKLVTQLIHLSHAHDDEVSATAGEVLSMLAGAED